MINFNDYVVMQATAAQLGGNALKTGSTPRQMMDEFAQNFINIVDVFDDFYNQENLIKGRLKALLRRYAQIARYLSAKPKSDWTPHDTTTEAISIDISADIICNFNNLGFEYTEAPTLSELSDYYMRAQSQWVDTMTLKQIGQLLSNDCDDADFDYDILYDLLGEALDELIGLLP